MVVLLINAIYIDFVNSIFKILFFSKYKSNVGSSVKIKLKLVKFKGDRNVLKGKLPKTPHPRKTMGSIYLSRFFFHESHSAIFPWVSLILTCCICEYKWL